METKEEKKERRPGYFARLKKKKQAKQNAETVAANSRGTTASRTQVGKDDGSKVILEQISSEDNCKLAEEKEECVTEEEKKKKKYNQLKDIRRTELKRYYNTDDNQNKTNEKKEKKMVAQKPLGTIEYTAGSQDTLNSIALKFNITPNRLVELNRLFTHTIVPGQVLYVPDTDHCSSAARLASSSPGAPVSPSSSDAEYDKLPDADLARKAFKPIERVLSSTSEEDEPIVVKFLKMNCRYFTDGKGVVGGVMIVTPNNIMFDPHKSDPLVIENGCEEYGLICPMEEVVSIALYNDISHMKIKDALPSDIPKDLCPLYRPGEWEDLSSEKDINPFSKFKSLSKEKRQQNGDDSKSIKSLDKEKSADFELLKPSDSTVSMESKSLEPPNDMASAEPSERSAVGGHTKEPSGGKAASDSKTKEHSLIGGGDDDFVELQETASPTNTRLDRKDAVREGFSFDPKESGKARSQVTKSLSEVQDLLAFDSLDTKNDVEPKADIDLESCEKQDVMPEVNKCASSPTGKVETTLDTQKELDKNKLIEFYLNKDKDGSQSSENLHKAGIGEGENNKVTGIDLTLSCSESQVNKLLTVKSGEPDSSCIERKEPSLEVNLPAVEEKDLKESVKSSSVPSLDKACQETQLDNNSEIRLWLLQRIQVPIEDMLPSKEEKSKTPPMFLCIKVGKPMRKSFVTQSTTMAQQYGKRRKQPEYWFAVPRERVDHLYTFFVQWSPEVYGKDAKEQGFVVVEKEELDMIDNFFSEPSTKSWEIITVEEAKRRKSICSYYEEDDDDSLPVLKHHSALLENMHIEQLARCLPARVQGYPWRLAYSTLEHGTSLKTLYRKSASLDSPVLLVVKDMDNQIFGAYATHPFRFSDHYYGTGETFLYTFSPNFKVFKWSGENTYFINGDTSSLELGGGGGRFGLWLDADLYHGRSNSCSTFNNDILSKKEDFIIQDVEVWTFE
ncbi:nuclear receptor coactivator 7 isoform X2 [Caretta caretta]|uniref:nuclear receptor coactivator 7 isoform X2 n=1 Tax=Caretta caretta TaxID=8467 RepID=UPI002096597B|nr:nuclear receptor coactivator 7 isoform X2 [Caretta caretta]XP_048700580.1 nuclear receptor coactivator 7 isoform X2 [Caretta caretta]XP_048700581.1 nuclear receptor coactivator 7 isoform X2 [Caretta caretta]XP_048700582.1 nuclear receptor coactivator 7 isoform X2 [Caretta caretta]